jgi:hypothetical protein
MKPNIRKILDVAEQVIGVAKKVLEEDRKPSKKKPKKRSRKL